MMAPQVSILIPVYNREKYIANCIQSALSQTFPNFEIIIVDNASDDGTWEICQQYAVLDSRVRIFRNDSNIGPVHNWIRCTQESKAEFSKILFSDDMLEPRCLELMLKELFNERVAFVYCAARIGEHIQNSVIFYGGASKSILLQLEYLDALLDGRAPVSPGAMLFRTRDLICNLHSHFPTSTPRPFENNGAGPDVMIALLTSTHYPFVATIREPLVFFRAHAESFTIANTNNQIPEGYKSAVAYFLKTQSTWLRWTAYVARNWHFLVMQKRKWVSPLIYFRAHEGQGVLLEIVAGCSYNIARWVVSKVKRAIQFL